MRFVTSAAEEIVKIRKEKGGDPNVRLSLYVRTIVHINALTPVCSLGCMQMLHACVCIRTYAHTSLLALAPLAIVNRSLFYSQHYGCRGGRYSPHQIVLYNIGLLLGELQQRSIRKPSKVVTYDLCCALGKPINQAGDCVTIYTAGSWIAICLDCIYSYCSHLNLKP